ncbi:methylated-DNA--[protein]-cysteine S-methyltransferase [Rhizobium sp. AG855]|uniref:methylated-DNA--[protein]-cysteine S-methyltransferase n=1 Tax=Rhizobium sp. AG855 TaxID=2183898 RepID=UPI000FF7A69C|nr:methylated-DNA--[protein]-cysteine S-methyltransferase [Rhizobium sp. AG855]RKE86525.1 methylated-DNA-[protein]-cysteine S-methyltransferase [Rhizobium sp. AG855]
MDERIMSVTHHYATFEAAHGHCAILWSENGIAGFRLPAASQEETVLSIHRRHASIIETDPDARIAGVIGRVKRYFDGEQSDFSDLPLDLSAPTDLYRQIYAATRRLAWGTATTYGALAAELELGPAGAWTIGQAMAKNPIPLIIPCHRVLAAGRKIGGFSAPGGTDAKLRMLELEGVELPETTPAQQSFAF